MNISKRIGFNIATNVASYQKNARTYEIIVCKIGIITSFIYSQTNPLTNVIQSLNFITHQSTYFIPFM